MFAGFFSKKEVEAMQMITQARSERLAINGAELEIREMPMREFFAFLSLAGEAGSDAKSACKLAGIIDSMIISGKLVNLDAHDVDRIVTGLIKVNMAEDCVIFPKIDKKTDKTELKYIDGAYLPIIDLVASEYGVDPLHILEHYTIRQLLIYCALIYNRKTGKDTEKIAIPGLAQEVKSLPPSEQKKHYEELYRQSLAL